MKETILGNCLRRLTGHFNEMSSNPEKDVFWEDHKLNFKALFDSSFDAITYGKIVLDANNKPVDSFFIEVNPAFEKQTGIPRKNAIGVSVNKLLPYLTNSGFDWLGAHSEVAFGGKEKSFEQYVKQIGRWYMVQIYRPKKGYFIGVFSDITNRKMMEQKSIQLLKLNELILESVPNILVEVNLQKRYVWTNQEGFNFFGGDCIGKEAKDYFMDDIDVYKIVEPLFEGRVDCVKLENWQRRNDGERRLLSWKCVPLKNDKGEIVGALSSAYDITELSLTEIELKKAEQKYEIVANNTYDWEFWTDENDVFVYTSPSCLQLTGYSAEEFYKDKNLFISILHPEDRDLYDEYTKKVMKRKVAEVDLRIISKSGKIVWISRICQRIYDADGNYLGLRGSNRDINQRKKAEINLSKSRDYLNNILRAVGAPLFVKDENHRFLLVNDAFCKWSGFAKEYMEGKLDDDIFPEEQTKIYRQDDDEVIRSGNSTLEEEKMSDANGDVHVVLTKKSLYINENGEKNIIGIITDITKRNEMETEIKKRNEELEKFNQFSIERELRMVNLKKEINELHKQLGLEKRYELT
jgi:PAS domain S-box-containing protein